MGRNRPSNEGAPRVPGEERSGPPWGRLVALLIGLILLAVLIPLACQAFGTSGGDSGDQGSGQQQDQDSERQKGADKAGSGDGKAGASAAGSGAGGGGSSKDAGDGSGGRGAAGTGNASAGASGGDTTGASAAGGSSDAGGGTVGAQAVAGGATADATAQIASIGGARSADGETVTIPRASISGSSGWIAVHEDDNGEPGDVLGHAPLREGQNTDVAVPLDRPVGSGRLYAMVHADEPADGKYTFPDGDPPVTADGDVVVEPLEYAVAGGTAQASARASTGSGAAAGGANAAEEPLPDTGGAPLPLLAGALLLVAGGLLSHLSRKGGG